MYALGAILYELADGPAAVPRGDGVRDGAAGDRAGARAALAAQRQVPRDLETICLKCLEKEPGRRYATAGELAADLARFLNDEPIRARRAGPLGRTGPVGSAEPGAGRRRSAPW